MDWWVIKQLRAMVLTDLREFIPEGYFDGETEKFRLHEGIKNAKHLSSELRWGYLGGDLGRKLFFESNVIMSAKQVSACEVLMNLGMLAAAEAAHGATSQLSFDAKEKGVSDGNAGAVAGQLQKEGIPVLSANVSAALKQYLRYLTPTEAAPFLPLLESEQLHSHIPADPLTSDAVTYFNQLCSADFADAWWEFERLQNDFVREESRNGRSIGGTGFAARLASIYADELNRRVQVILANLQKMHADFGAPIGAGIETQLKDLGLKSLDLQVQGLDGSYIRYLNRFGMSGSYASGLDQKYPLCQVSISNTINRYLWRLRKIPMKSSKTPDAPTFIFHAPVAAVLTGPNATANIQQQWTGEGSAALAEALVQLRAAVDGATDLDSKLKDELVAGIDLAEAELKTEVPNKTKLLDVLSGIAIAVQTLGSAQPAIELVRSAARVFGIPL